MWLSLAFLSAALLGLYDISKKFSVNGNAVIPVLFFNTLFCSLIFLPLVVMSAFFPQYVENTIFFLPSMSWQQHSMVILKSFIVLASWMSGFFAVKHLPITLCGPIKATQPVMTLLGAILIFGEVLNLYQWIGVSIAILSFFLLSLSGKKEGIHFTHNRWILFAVIAMVTGALSGLYDKYLMSNGYNHTAVLVWYCFYQMIIMGIVALTMWYPKRTTTTPFTWRWSIPLISLFLACADFVYFYALSQPQSMISIVSMVRRSSVVVSFIGGAYIFRERNLRSKALDLLLLLISMLFLYIGTHK